MSKSLCFLAPLAVFLAFSLAACSPASKLRDQGLSFYQQGDYSDALSKFDAALKYDEFEPKANYYAGASNYNLGRYSEAAYHYKLAWKADPNYPDVKLGYAESLIKQGKKDQALDDLERDAALTAKPEDRINLAAMYEKLGDMDNAQINYQKAQALAPTNADVQIAAGQFFERVGKKDLAANAYIAAYRIDPTRTGLVQMLTRNGISVSDAIRSSNH